jgi:hypothetical protein
MLQLQQGLVEEVVRSAQELVELKIKYKVVEDPLAKNHSTKVIKRSLIILLVLLN